MRQVKLARADRGVEAARTGALVATPAVAATVTAVTARPTAATATATGTSFVLGLVHADGSPTDIKAIGSAQHNRDIVNVDLDKPEPA